MKTVADIQPGQTFGRYEFLVPIAQGGMASVWAARLKGSRGFSKTVAVKTMLPIVSEEPQFEQMFLDEAAIASRIRHPHVAEILDLGEQDNLLYLVMELVDGEPLSAIRWLASKQGGVPLPIGVKIIVDACSGLHAVHELKDEFGEPVGLVHRDISPQNILVGYDGLVKLVDFGVAKAAGRTAQNTSVGEVKGKPPYMSPEQALGMVVDRRTDLFAMGIVLYQVTTGKHPLRGETDIATLQNIISDRPVMPPSQHVRGYPPALEAIVLRALNRDPAKRFQTACEMGAALEELFIDGELPRVRAEDIGKYLSQLFGEAGEERRGALRAAIRLADERAFGAQNEPRREGVPEDEQLRTTVTRPGLEGAPDDSGSLLGAVTRNPLDAELGGGVASRWLGRRSPYLIATLAALVLGAVMVGVLGTHGLGQPAAAVRAEDPANHPRVAAPAVVPHSVSTPAATAEETMHANPSIAPAASAAQDVASLAASKRTQRTKPDPTPPPQRSSSTAPVPTPLASEFVPPPLPNPGF